MDFAAILETDKGAMKKAEIRHDFHWKPQPCQPCPWGLLACLVQNAECPPRIHLWYHILWYGDLIPVTLGPKSEPKQDILCVVQYSTCQRENQGICCWRLSSVPFAWPSPPRLQVTKFAHHGNPATSPFLQSACVRLSCGPQVNSISFDKKNRTEVQENQESSSILGCLLACLTQLWLLGFPVWDLSKDKAEISPLCSICIHSDPKTTSTLST